MWVGSFWDEITVHLNTCVPGDRGGWWWSVLALRLEFGEELPIRTNTSDNQPNSGFRMTPPPVFASESMCAVRVSVYGFGDIFRVPVRPLRHI